MEASKTTVVLYDPYISSNLSALLKRRPIGLLQVGNKPLVAQWCEYCVENKITQLVIYVHKFSLMVEEFVGSGRRWGDLTVAIKHCKKPMNQQQVMAASVGFFNRVIVAKTNCLPENPKTTKPILINDLKALWLANMVWLQQVNQMPGLAPMSKGIVIDGNNYVGRHCKLLPQTKLNSVVIEHECFIDEHCCISNTVITHGSIVGCGLCLDSAIVDGQLLYRADLDLVTWINDANILGSKLASPTKSVSSGLIKQLLHYISDAFLTKLNKTLILTK